jgi:gluconolactonase
MKVTVHEPLVFDVLGTGLGFPEGPVFDDDSVLVVDIDGGRVVRVGGNGNQVVATTGGGPNGLALGLHRTAVVANNGGFLWTESNGVRIPIDHPTHTNEPPGFTGGWIERIDLDSGAVTVLHREYEGHPLRGPNDLVFDEAGGLWFTDHGKGRYESVDRGALYYAPADGGPLERAAFPLLGPNGVGLAPDGTKVYGAETFTGRLWAWDLEGPVEADGRIAIGALGDGIVVVTPDGSEADVHPIPGDVTTNIAFGGSDYRRAVITLSRSGRLVETNWPRPGLPLHVG